MIRPDLSLPIPENIEAAHFIGIGGSGMSGLARMFLDRGIRVSGSDRADSPALRELAALGARVHVGHDAANLGDADTVVHTGAIWPENPEFVHREGARAARHPPLAGAALAHRRTPPRLGRRRPRQDHLDRDDRHGAAARSAPTRRFVNGGVIAQLGASSGTGADDLFVIEADESDGTFLLYDTVGRPDHERRPRPPRPLGLATRRSTPRSPRSRTGERGRRHLGRRRRRARA